MTAIEVAGYAAFVTNFAGNLLLTGKSLHGWWIRIVSNILWFISARDTTINAVTVNAIAFFCLNMWGLYKWLKDERKKNAGSTKQVGGGAPRG